MTTATNNTVFTAREIINIKIMAANAVRSLRQDIRHLALKEQEARDDIADLTLRVELELEPHGAFGKTVPETIASLHSEIRGIAHLQNTKYIALKTIEGYIDSQDWNKILNYEESK